MVKKKQLGSVVEILVIIILLLIIAGLVVWRLVESSETAQNSTSNTSASVADNDGKTDEVGSNKGYLVLRDWGVKIKLGDVAEKVSVKISNQPGEYAAGLFKYDGVAEPSFLPESLKDKTCSASLSLFRARDESSVDTYTRKKVGDYYYIVTGSPYHCGDPNDDAIKSEFISNFKPENVEAL